MLVNNSICGSLPVRYTARGRAQYASSSRTRPSPSARILGMAMNASSRCALQAGIHRICFSLLDRIELVANPRTRAHSRRRRAPPSHQRPVKTSPVIRPPSIVDQLGYDLSCGQSKRAPPMETARYPRSSGSSPRARAIARCKPQSTRGIEMLALPHDGMSSAAS